MIIVNRSRQPLHVECLNCGIRNEKFSETVRNRKVIQLKPGRYQLNLYYENANIDVESSLNGELIIGEVASPMNPKYLASLVILNNLEQHIRLYCYKRISIASIIEGVEARRN